MSRLDLVSRKSTQEVRNAIGVVCTKYTAFFSGVEVYLKGLERSVSAPGHDKFNVSVGGFHHVCDKGVAQAVAGEAVGAAVV